MSRKFFLNNRKIQPYKSLNSSISLLLNQDKLNCLIKSIFFIFPFETKTHQTILSCLSTVASGLGRNNFSIHRVSCESSSSFTVDANSAVSLCFAVPICCVLSSSVLYPVVKTGLLRSQGPRSKVAVPAQSWAAGPLAPWLTKTKIWCVVVNSSCGCLSIFLMSHRLWRINVKDC